MSDDGITCCPLDSGDGDEASVFKQSNPRASKPHKCSECGEEIPKGARYELVNGCWDGSWSKYRTCLSCCEIRDHFACNGFIYGQLWSDIEDNFFPDMRAGGACMEGLSPAAKGRLFERRLAWLARPGGRQWLELWADNVISAREDAAAETSPEPRAG